MRTRANRETDGKIAREINSQDVEIPNKDFFFTQDNDQVHVTEIFQFRRVKEEVLEP